MNSAVPLVATFYDELAPHYHLLYGDWEEAVARQGAALGSMLAEAGVPPQSPILDAACGIGTQTIGLVRCGYQVTASDISPRAVERTRSELSARGLQATVRVDNLRTLEHTESGSMAAVLACDNSLPHLLSDAALLEALRSCFRCLRPGGIAAFSLRDYAAMPRINPDVRPYGLRREGGNRLLAVQVWEWDGDQYDLSLYLTTEFTDGKCSTRVLRSRYYAITIQRLLVLLMSAGFVEPVRRDDILFQPLLIVRRPNVV